MKKITHAMLASTAFALLAQAAFATTAPATAEKTATKTDTAAPAKSAADDKGPKPIALKITGQMVALTAITSQSQQELGPLLTAQNQLSAGINKGIDQYNGRDGYAPTFAVPKSDVYFTVGGQTAAGTKYGYVACVKALAKNADVSRSYVEFSGDFGTVQFGNVKGVDDSMATYGAYGVMGGNGGGVSDYQTSVFNLSAGVIQGTTIVGAPDIATKISYISPSVGSDELGNFTFGVSYTPNTTHRSKAGKDISSPQTDDSGNEGSMYPTGNQQAYGLNNFVFGLTYGKKWGDLELQLNAVTAFESGRFVFKPEATYSGYMSAGSRTMYNTGTTNSFALSAQINYKDVSVAASYLDNRRSRLQTAEMEAMAVKGTASDAANQNIDYSPDDGQSYTNQTALNKLEPFMYLYPDGTGSIAQGNSGKAWNVGASYKFGAYKAALGYFNTCRKTSATDKATLNAVSATLDLQALDGLVFFSELTVLKTQTTANMLNAAMDFYEKSNTGKDGIATQLPTANNKGAILMIGTKVSF